jgi:hypothetical protein
MNPRLAKDEKSVLRHSMSKKYLNENLNFYGDGASDKCKIISQ